MKVKALSLKSGDRITAYFRNKMQVCTIKKSTASNDQTNITLSVFISEHYRYLSSGVICFKSETLVDLIN